MGVCDSSNQAETLEKGNKKGEEKGIRVIHTLIQPIIHQEIQPVITENIKPLIIKTIIPVIVRNEFEAQNIPRDLIMKHPDVKYAKVAPVLNEKQPPKSEKKPEDWPQEIVEETEEPSSNKEYEPTLANVVGNVNHYIQVKEKHIRQKIIQHITKETIKYLDDAKIVPVLSP